MLNRKSLPETDQELLENLLLGDVETLDEEQLGYLRARREYLNPEERARFKLDDEPKPKAAAKGKGKKAKDDEDEDDE